MSELYHRLPNLIFLTFEIKCTYLHLTVSLIPVCFVVIMFRFDHYTLKYDRYIVVLTKRAGNENLKVNNATENFLP